jgi:hypothetical protein
MSSYGSAGVKKKRLARCRLSLIYRGTTGRRESWRCRRAGRAGRSCSRRGRSRPVSGGSSLRRSSGSRWSARRWWRIPEEIFIDPTDHALLLVLYRVDVVDRIDQGRGRRVCIPKTRRCHAAGLPNPTGLLRSLSDIIIRPLLRRVNVIRRRRIAHVCHLQFMATKWSFSA